ncbi:MAG: hypothetical protein A2744_01970 [Candidatus Buchananbacteria bacterium RIFCSPHIGHO2_01_FULL_44_11]|uniref:Right handed beta helix domain-containing protein n=1 Tax=Candidatus Buchananbacteria bacterium RIFCSPHIGHO2_01_FULL_44_11 TaxID=1797535 RepID=A0A1G1Y1D2_9BACT|nr:MAG: hypothetical protein A2744_01970 [Candidatus Buchananbacteria bacterium RIFCSPHIGHO2_01_FULL_44_11]
MGQSLTQNNFKNTGHSDKITKLKLLIKKRAMVVSLISIATLCLVVLTIVLAAPGPSDWYVRPGSGSGDGTSYATAWRGLENVIFGSGGVQAGDTLYICGTHTAVGTQVINIPSGTAISRITIRMDCPSSDDGKVFGYIFNLGGSSYLTFYKCYFDAAPIVMDNPDDPGPPVLFSHDVTIDSCVLKNDIDNIIDLYAGNDNWIIRNSDLSQSETGIYTHTSVNAAGGASYLTVENNFIHDMCLTPAQLANSDCHAVGIQNGSNITITKNQIWNTGAAIEFWSWPTAAMTNNTISYNFIKDIKVASVTEGGGIRVSNHTSPGLRTGFKIYSNIIESTGLGGSGTQGNGIELNLADPVEVYNNVIKDARGTGISIKDDNSATTYGVSGFVYNNIIVNPGNYYVSLDGRTYSNAVDLDYNVYSPYPAAGKFYFRPSGTYGANSIFTDPNFLNASGNFNQSTDFQLQATSLAIDQGRLTWLTEDFAGNTIPYDSTAADIGAFEYTPGNTVATPNVQPGTGTYTSPIAITLSSATAGATIRYTTDGSEPTGSSVAYAGTFQVSGSPGNSITLKAKGFKVGMTSSDTAINTFTIPLTLPDITIDSIATNPAQPVVGQPVAIIVIGHNNGGINLTSSQGVDSFSSDFSTFVQANPPSFSPAIIDAGHPLLSGQIFTYTFQGSFNTVGSANLLFSIDQPSALAESNESNNTFSRTVIVSATAPVLAPFTTFSNCRPVQSH